MVYIKKGEIYSGVIEVKPMKHDPKSAIGEKYIANDLKHNGILSMLYVISKRRPQIVRLTLNDWEVFGECDWQHIHKVDTNSHFEEFGGEIFDDTGNEIKRNGGYTIGEGYNKYKVVMYGKEGNINCRNGFETESYFFPMDKLKHMTVDIEVCFDPEEIRLGHSCWEGKSLPISKEEVEREQVYIISECIYPAVLFDIISCRKNIKEIYRVSNGAMGNTTCGDDRDSIVQLYINGFNDLKPLEKGVV